MSSAEKDYNFYRYKAGLNFDKFIKLHPDKDGEEIFTTFMKRYDAYYKQRSTIVRKYEKKYANEYDEENLPRIIGEKMHDLAQLEQMFIDVLRIVFGISPDDDTAKFGDTIETRYTKFIESHVCLDEINKGLYMGDDGLFRLISFYDDDEVDFLTLFRWHSLDTGHAYKPDFYASKEGSRYDIELYVDGVKAKLPEPSPGDYDLQHQLRCLERHLDAMVVKFAFEHPEYRNRVVDFDPFENEGRKYETEKVIVKKDKEEEEDKEIK